MADPHALYDQAVVLKDQGDLKGAVAKLDEVLQIDETYSLAHAALAVYRHQLGELEQAVEHAKRVTELQPEDPFSFMQLSVICQRCGKIPETEHAMEVARRMQ